MNSVSSIAAFATSRAAADIQTWVSVAAAAKALDAHKATGQALVALLNPDVGNNLNVSA